MIFGRIAVHFADRASEWILAGMFVTWGMNCLLISPEVWASPVYQGLAVLMTKEFCGILALSIGLVRLAALYINGTRRRSPHARAVCAFLGCFFWLQLTFGLVFSPSASLGTAIVPWLLIADMWNVYRAARDARLSDMKMMPVEGAVPDAASA